MIDALAVAALYYLALDALPSLLRFTTTEVHAMLVYPGGQDATPATAYST